MTRDNILFALIGILIGFIAGYLMQETMASRQPTRLVHGQQGMVAPGAGAPSGAGRPNAVNAMGAQAQAEAQAEEIAQLEAFLETDPEDPRAAVLRLANLTYDVGNWPDCVKYYERFLELEPGQPDVFSDLGVCYRELGEPDKAIASFHKAQELEPDHWQSMFNEVVILAFDLKDYDRAAQVLETLRELQPDNATVQGLSDEVARRQAAS